MLHTHRELLLQGYYCYMWDTLPDAMLQQGLIEDLIYYAKCLFFESVWPSMFSGWNCGRSVEKQCTASPWSQLDCSHASVWNTGSTHCEFVHRPVRLHFVQISTGVFVWHMHQVHSNKFNAAVRHMNGTYSRFGTSELNISYILPSYNQHPPVFPFPIPISVLTLFLEAVMLQKTTAQLTTVKSWSRWVTP